MKSVWESCDDDVGRGGMDVFVLCCDYFCEFF